MEVVKAFGNYVWKTIRPFIITFTSILIINLLLICIAVEGFNVVIDEVKNSYGILDNKFTSTLLSWIGINNDEKFDELMLLGSPVAPKKIPKYIEIESQSYPTTATVEMKVDKNGSISYQNHELDIGQTAIKYRLPWQFVQGMDIVNLTSDDEDNMEFLNSVKGVFTPSFEWGYDKYTRDVTNYTKSWSVTTKSGGSADKSKVNETYETQYIPLPYADTITTGFKTYKYTFDENVTTSDTGWGETVITGTKTWSKTVPNGVNENGETKYKTIHYKKVSYAKYRKKVVEDVIHDIIEEPNLDKVDNFIQSNNLNRADLDLIGAMIDQLPDSAIIKKDIEDIADWIYNYKGTNNIPPDTGNVGGGGNTGDIDLGDIDGTPTSPTKYKLPKFYQYDPRWAWQPYGESTVKSGGCGPSSFSMIVTGMKASGLKNMDRNGDGILDPLEACTWSANHGHKVYNNGTAWSFFPDASKTIGINVNFYSPSSYREVYEALKKGQPVIASMKPGHFTRGGHFIVLAGVDSNGKVIVNDPASEQRSYMTWSFTSIIVPEAAAFWVFSE